ncbi:DUF6434 domain-containing protein [Bacillus weihaiensis]|uniref:Cytoplasmic protein n=1 Tax=Bacillus weihaiensis TaxID=1547283 RepID=A0A1L3MTP8_9BACI|nr:DUF6434 domain-containing protein [Bacillus weihaiensis]APH05709.1 cytoplasmic protein [Bacillus weihaiensis]
MRPTLTKDINQQEFKDYYWLKKELQAFCREHGLKQSGSKNELTEAIVSFLETGQVPTPIKKKRLSTRSRSTQSEILSLQTVITENHRCSQEVRAFFKSIIPNFHFSTHIQHYFKTHAGCTYQDAVAAWYEEETRKKDPSYKRQIGQQFEYNQFIRDFFADEKNRDTSKKEAIEAWKLLKSLPGHNKYQKS